MTGICVEASIGNEYLKEWKEGKELIKKKFKTRWIFVSFFLGSLSSRLVGLLLSSSTTTSIPSCAPLSTPAASPTLIVPRELVFLDLVNDLVRDPEVLDGISTEMDFRESPELLSVRGRANDFFQIEVHEPVTGNEMAIVRFSFCAYATEKVKE